MQDPIQILVIDDSEADFRLVERQLRRQDVIARCVHAATPAALAERLAERAWDIVLADYHVPGLEFHEMLADIRRVAPAVPVLLVTGSIGEDHTVDLLRGGICDYVHKDRLGRLASAVRRCLRDAAESRDRAEMEKALRDSQADLHHAQAIGQIGSWRLDVRRNVLTWSPENHRIFGIPEGTPLSYDIFLACIHPDDREYVDRRWRAALKGEHYDVEHRLLIDGQVRWVRERADLEFGPDGLLSGGFGTTQDITDQKVVERVLADYQDRLETARREALRLARVKSEFLANMSHEIRTPLNAVLGLAQAGMRQHVGHKSGTTFARILDAGELLLGIINDILDFSKIEADRLVVEKVPVDLAQVVERATAMVTARARDKGLGFAVRRAEDLPAGFLGDGLRVTQVLMNLLSNATKFTARGEVGLSVSRDAERLYFCVSDSGIGIAPEQLERLFDAFEQLDASTTRRYGGTGLGLAISRQLARLMGGDITVVSVLGQGSRFTLSLPLVEAALPARSTVQAATAGPRLIGLRILSADDSADNRLVLAELLEPEGALLTQVENGRLAVDAVGQAGAGRFDVVLMDIQMPVMDGYAATRALHKLVPDLPVIGVTAHALAEERERILAAGMVAHVPKPVHLDDLVDALLRATGRDAVPPAPTFAAPAAVSTSSRPSALDMPALLARYKGKADFVMRLLHTVRTNHADMPARLRGAAEAGDLEQAMLLAHSLKGISGNIAARETQALAHEVERACRDIAAGVAGAVPAAGLLALADAFAALLSAIDAELGDDMTGAGG
ncbi:MAG: response regulator [Rhodocyclaceae bacterium]|nr:response regulator [Rhodocyclaceae bacterium]